MLYNNYNINYLFLGGISMYKTLLQDTKNYIKENYKTRCSVSKKIIPGLSKYISNRSLELGIPQIGITEIQNKTATLPQETEDIIANEVVKDIIFFLAIRYSNTAINHSSILKRMNDYEMYLRKNYKTDELNWEEKEIVLQSLDAMSSICSLAISNESIEKDFQEGIKTVEKYINKK